MTFDQSDLLPPQQTDSASNFAANPNDEAPSHSSGAAPFQSEAPGSVGTATPAQTQGDRPQIWIVGTRDQVVHLMNEFTVKRVTSDRAKFTPIVPAPFARDKYMTVLVR